MSRLYGDSAFVWELLTPKGVYQEEAQIYWSLLNDGRVNPIRRLVELGSGGGYLAQHMTAAEELILVDQSPEMITLSKIKNPSARHLCQDMCAVEFSSPVDAVILHDAVMYLTNRSDVLQCLKNVRRQLSSNGRVIIIPDVLKETFFEHIQSGEAQNDTHHVHLTEWRWVPENEENGFNVAFSVLLRQGDVVKSFFEVHQMGYFSYSEWLAIFEEANLKVVPFDIFEYSPPRELFLLSC